MMSKLRPLGEHAAHHRRRLRRRRRRRRRGHRAAVRQRLGRPTRFGRRIARNTSSLLIEESHVAAVTDPAGGAYAVEKLTDDLAVAGWAELGRIEAAGGVAASTRLARVAERVADASRRARRAGRRPPARSPGVTEFPNLGEVLPERAPDAGADRVRRYGAEFEALRDEPAGGPVFLATMGTVAAHTARATFATNLFAAGGIAVEAAGPTAGVDDGARGRYDGPAGRVPRRHRRGVRRVGRRPASPPCATAGATWVVVAGRPAATLRTSTTRAPWASTRSTSWPDPRGARP